MKKIAKPSIMAVLTLTLGLCASVAQAQTPNSVYVIDGRGEVATNNFGQCWRTGFWTPAAAAASQAICGVEWPKPWVDIQPSRPR